LNCPCDAFPGLFASATRDDQGGELIIKLVNPAPETRNVAVHLAGAKGIRDGAKELVLTGTSLDDVNSFDEPKKIAPVEQPAKVSSPDFEQSVPPRALIVLRIPADR
jgi:alpha-L-arabinofuranosidase